MASLRRRSPAQSSKPVYHLVPHTHWDREWYRPFEVFRARLVECIDELLDILDHDKSFTAFMLDGQASVLDDYLELRPERKADIVRHIQSGRIATGPWYTLPDEFLVSGESIIRNLLLGTARAQSFGHSMDVGYVPDSFGHAAAMPMIFRGFGMHHAITWRGFGGEPGEDHAEWVWRSADGSRVLMHHLHRDGYSAATFTGLTQREAVARFRGLQRTVDARATTRHRLLLSGGDHHFPDAELPAIVRALRKNTGADIRISTLENFFTGLDNTHPSVDILNGELAFGYRNAFVVRSGVYSSRMPLKQQNWRLQKLFTRYAEPLMALASLHGYTPDRALLEHGWKQLLRNHAHDSICGCSVDAVHDEMMTRFAQAEEIGGVIIAKALEQLAPIGPQSSGDDTSIIVFNPSAVERSGHVALGVEMFLRDVTVGLNPDVRPAPAAARLKGMRISDESGAALRFQITNRTDAFGIAESRSDYPKQSRVERLSLLIDAPHIPALGLATFNVARAKTMPAFRSSLRIHRRVIENKFVKLSVANNGTIDLFDKKTKKLVRGLHVFEDGGDAGDEYSYSYPERDRILTSEQTSASCVVIERGPLRATLNVSVTMKIPSSLATNKRSRSTTTESVLITSRISLHEDSPVVNIHTTFTNTCRDHRLRVLFPTSMETAVSHADQHFGVVQREHRTYNTSEFSIEHPSPVHPMQRFVTIQDAMAGLTLLSDGQPEYEWRPSDMTLALTLLRCVGTLSESDLITRPGGDAGWKNDTPGAQCLGEHEFRYAFFIHAPESWNDVEQQAERYHAPMIAATRKIKTHGAAGICTISNPKISLTTVKPKVRVDGMVVRMFNTSGEDVQCVISLHRRIKTVHRARIDETKQKQLLVKHGTIALEFKPFETMTLVCGLPTVRR